MSKIRIVNGPYRGREKTLGDKPLTIGRDAEAGIQILDRSASRFHAEIFPVGGMSFVRDLDSKNGTYINDERLGEEELLREGDIIKIGTTELVYEIGNALSDDDSSRRIAYQDDPDMLSNTLEFRIDELSDIDELNEEPTQENARSLRILYQVGRILSSANDDQDKDAKVLDFLVQAMQAESALIFRREASTGKLVPTTVRTSGPLVQPVISRSIIKKTFSENKALHSANAQEDERFERNASVIQKGIRGVICVPLTIAGHTRGVLYLSRSAGITPFDQLDLELISACAIQLGLTHHAVEQYRRQRTNMWKVMLAMVRSLERPLGCLNAGERCARTCTALANAAHLSAVSRERLRYAGLLHHFDRLSGGIDGQGQSDWSLLENIEDLDGVLPLVQAAQLRGDGRVPLTRVADKMVEKAPDKATMKDADKASEEDMDIEARILAVATAFEQATSADPGRDPTASIDELSEDPALDNAITNLLHGCHLDGSLYANQDQQ